MVHVHRDAGTRSSCRISHAKAQGPANYINGHIWALEGVLGDLAGAKVALKVGVDEVNADSAARNKPKRKRGGAEQEKK